MAVAVLTHGVFFLVQVRFFRLQVLGFTGRELAVLDPVGNAILLVVLALLDFTRLTGGRGRGRAGLLRECRRSAQNYQGRRTQNTFASLHDRIPLSKMTFISSVSPRKLVERPYDS